MEVHVLCEDVWLTWWHEESIRRMELEKGSFFLLQCSAGRDSLMLPCRGLEKGLLMAKPWSKGDLGWWVRDNSLLQPTCEQVWVSKP